MEQSQRSNTQNGTRALAADHRARVEQHGGPVIQICASCAETYFPPRLRCARCGSLELNWQPTNGRGTVSTWVTVHHPEETPSMAIPSHLKSLTPFSTVFVNLSDWPGIRVASLHLGQESDSSLVAGMEMEVRLDQVEGSEVLVCHPRSSTDDGGGGN